MRWYEYLFPWNWFKDNKILQTIIIQEIALAAFKKNPSIKPVVYNALDSAIKAIEGGGILNVEILPELLKSKVSLPEDQKLILGPAIDQLLTDFSKEVMAEISDKKIVSPTAQLVEAIKILSVVRDFAKEAK